MTEPKFYSDFVNEWGVPSILESESKLDSILTPEMMQLLCSWMENDYSGSDISTIVNAPWPPEVSGANGTIYRGEGLTQSDFEKLKAGTYKARGSSWTTDFKTASAFAHDDEGWEGNERVHRFIFTHDGSKNDVALNFEKLAATPEFKSRLEKGDIKMCSPEEGVRAVDEKEVLSKGLLPLTIKNILKVYVGKEWEPVDPKDYLKQHAVTEGSDVSAFISVVTKVAEESGFADGEMAYWKCTEFSVAVKQLADEVGVPAEVITTETACFNADRGEMKKGESCSHAYLKIGNKYYDFTARQFDDTAKFPIVKTSPIYPDSTRMIDIETDQGSGFYFEKLWKAYSNLESVDMISESTKSLIAKWDTIAKRPNFNKWWLKQGEEVTDDFRNYGADDYPPFHEPFSDSDDEGGDNIRHGEVKTWLKKAYADLRKNVPKILKSDGSNLILYRCVKADSLDDIDLSKVGTAWGMTKEAADCSLVGNRGKEEFIFTALAPLSAVMIDFSLAANLNPFTDEAEIRLKTGHQIEVVSITHGDEEQLEKPVKANTGYGQGS